MSTTQITQETRRIVLKVIRPAYNWPLKVQWRFHKLCPLDWHNCSEFLLWTLQTLDWGQWFGLHMSHNKFAYPTIQTHVSQLFYLLCVHYQLQKTNFHLKSFQRSPKTKNLKSFPVHQVVILHKPVWQLFWISWYQFYIKTIILCESLTNINTTFSIWA